MKTLKQIFICVFVLTIFAKANAQPVKLWETGEIYKAPESVAYDSERGFLYISNYTQGVKTGGAYGEHCISKANLQGEIIKFDWINNLTTPTGICISNDKLYIVERFGVVEYDLKADKISNKILFKTTNNADKRFQISIFFHINLLNDCHFFVSIFRKLQRIFY